MRKNEFFRISYYLFCVVFSMIGVFFLGKGWFYVVSLLVLGVPVVNWLLRDKRDDE